MATTATAPPPTPCPPALAAQALPVLTAAVAAAAPGGPSALLPALSAALSTMASARIAGVRLPAPLGPLHAFVSYADAAGPGGVPLPLLCDALLAYPADTAALGPAVAAMPDDTLRSLVLALTHRLTTASSPSAPASLSRSPRTLLATSRLLHALLRADDTAASIILEEAEGIVPVLSKAYALLPGDRDSVRAKSEALTFVRALANLAGPGKNAVRSLLGRTGAKRTPLVDNAMADDYELFGHARPDDAQAQTLRALHDDERGDDPRLVPLQALFPSLPAHLLADALAHPAFAAAGSRATVDEQAAPLVDAILAGTLPADLGELRAAAAGISAGAMEADEPAPEDVTGTGKANGVPAKIERRNVFDDMDFSKLRLKGQIEPTVGAEIPDNLRASILRLVEAQEVEAEEAARAVAEAQGVPYVPGRDAGLEYDSDLGSGDEQPRLRLRDGDADSEDDEEAGTRAASPAPSAPAPRANEAQTVLELTYLRDPSLFNRDAATRRSNARKDLRAATGMDDSQIEGWKIMLERNPHKDAILERHQWSRGPSGGGAAGSAAGKEKKDKKDKEKKEGGGGGGGKSSGGGGGGGGGGSSSRGGGSGRGRGANKGSRGHSNAARTRGHDRKLQRMGAGL